MKYTNDCVHVTNTATGTGLFAYMGQAYSASDALAVDITTSAVGFSRLSPWREGQQWRADGRMLVTKAAINASDLILDNGRARTLDGKQYVATAAVAGAPVNRYIHELPYDALGRLKVNEV